MDKILSVNDLEIDFHTNGKTIHAIRKINFDLHEKEIIAFVGESGSGKSCLMHAIIQLLDSSAKITNGKILFEEENLLQKSQKDMQKIRGKKISIIFQDPFSSLNPTMKIGKQILEAIDKNPSKEKVYELLNDVGIQDAHFRYNQYPHQISGGMRQRVMIAIAIASNPKIIIADEPTTSLDISYQMQIIELLKKINEKYMSSIIFISHDLSLVGNIVSKIYIMYAGKILEKGSKEKILYFPKHPYTKFLINAIPKIDEDKQINLIEDYAFNAFEKKESICLFYPRCPFRKKICSTKYPKDIILEKDQTVTCFLYKNNQKEKKCQTNLFRVKI
jgi:oligopeptide/dipeptide ABC transporter ATP-binding protein